MTSDREPVKACSTCGETKPLESFYRYHRNKDGRMGRCKRCFGEAQKRNEAIRRARSRWAWMRRYT